MARQKNINIKKANQQVSYTVDQVEELRRCSEDPVYFIRKYVKIQHPKHGAIPFELYEYQVRLIQSYVINRFNIVLSARQTGKSTTSAAYLLWYAIFHFDKTVLIASNKNKNAMEMIHRIRFAYENLPMWLKPGVTDDGWNKHSVAFDNGSRIESTATTPDSGRGMSISLLFLDEFAFVKPSVQEEFWTSMSPTLATGGACIICSTPNGDSNLFAQLWRGAEVEAAEFDFKANRVHWYEPPGRDENFKKAEIAKIGELKWRQEYECEFLSSDALLISSVVLNNLTKLLGTVLFEKNEIKFYKKINPQGTYLIGVDPSTGTGNDFSVIEVYEFPSLEQVAEYRSNSTSSPQLYTILKYLLRYLEKYNTRVFFSVENNGIGEGVISLYTADEAAPIACEFISEEGRKRLGMTTTHHSKIKACNTLKQLIEQAKLKIASKILLAELKRYVRSSGTYQAQRGSTDDAISAILIVIRLLEEMASYEQQAFDTLYKVNEEEYLNEEEYDDNDEPTPVVV